MFSCHLIVWVENLAQVSPPFGERTVMEGTDDFEPTVTLAVAVIAYIAISLPSPYDGLYEALMSAVPFEFPLIKTFLGVGHPMAAQLMIHSIEAMLELLEVHSAATGIRAGITCGQANPSGHFGIGG